jgi:type I restriction enzyme M protein
LKTRQVKREHLDDFIAKYKPGERHTREDAEHFKRWTYEQLAERPGFNLDVWADVVDHSFDDPASLAAPEVIAAGIVEMVSAALDEFAAVAAELNETSTGQAAARAD